MTPMLRHLVLATATLLLVPASAWAARFKLDADAGHVLVIEMPAGWRAHTTSPEGQPIRTLSFTTGTPGSVKLLVTVLPLPPGGSPPSLPDLRESVEAAADVAEANSVETYLTTVDLLGAEVSGAYFNATDRAPAPGEYKHLTQGVLAVKSTVVSFTLLANDEVPGGVAQARAQALSALRGVTRAAQ